MKKAPPKKTIKIQPFLATKEPLPKQLRALSPQKRQELIKKGFIAVIKDLKTGNQKMVLTNKGKQVAQVVGFSNVGK